MTAEGLIPESVFALGMKILGLSRRLTDRRAFKKELITLLMRYFQVSRLDILVVSDSGPCLWQGLTDESGDMQFKIVIDSSAIAGLSSYWKHVANRTESESRPFLCMDDSRLLQPFRIEGSDDGGFLVLYDNKEPQKNQGTQLRLIADFIAMAISHRNTQWALGERIKELTCLLQMSVLRCSGSSDLEKLFNDALEIIPDAFQFGQYLSARIELDNRVAAESGRFREGPELFSPIQIRGQSRGILKVAYDKAKLPGNGSNPFLDEEQPLLDSISRYLALFIEDHERDREKTAMENQLRHADRLATIGQLAAGVAHELNEPINSILGFAELVQKEGGEDPYIRRDTEKIVAASQRAGATVRKLLQFSRQLPAETGILDLNAQLREAGEFLTQRCINNAIDLVYDLDPRIPAMKLNPSHVHQIIINVAVNAIQAMKQGGSLYIRTRLEDSRVLIEVEDTGPGIPPELHESIFLPFFTTKDIGEGTGLGLAVVHGIITSYGGSTEVRNRPEGGCRFSLRLPVTTPVFSDGDAKHG